MKLVSRILACCLLIFFLTVQVGFSQSRSGTILGRVTDSSGGAIAGATVTITEQQTNAKRTVIADTEGRYEAPLLPIGKYRITVVFQGFKESTASDVVLETQQNKELDFTLYPASMTSEVRVNTGAVAVEVERTNATLGQVIHSEQVSELPLNGRDFVQLGTLAPGVTKGEAAFFNNRGISEVSIRGSVSLAVQGMREN
ncbi:MAG: carboxypeptidase-like regulatory domain-containing protein, partial [Candidatus Acidiferrales bacterium]